MNFKTTRVLIIILAIVGIAVLFIPRDDDRRTATQNEGRERKLFDVEPSAVSKVTVTGADGRKLVLEKAGSDWRMIEPVNAPADTWAVDSLVRSVSGAKTRGQLDLVGENLKSTGLDSPSYVVEFTKDQQTFSYKVGKKQAIGDSVYIQVGDARKAEVVGGDVYEQLEKPFSSFRQNKLVTVSSGDIRQIRVERPEGGLFLARSGDSWEVIEPQRMPAESADVSDMTWAISSLSAQEFVTEAEVPSVLRPDKNTTMTVWFSTTQPTTQPATQPTGTTVRFGGFDSVMKKNVYVSVDNPPALAKVSATAMDSFKKEALSLRDRKVLDIDPATVSMLSIVTDTPATTQPTTRPASQTALLIERKKETATLGPELPATQPATSPATQASTQPAATQPAPPPSNWTLKGEKDADASQARVEELLGKFHPLRVDKYLKDAAPTTQPTATYTVTLTVQKAGATEPTRHTLTLVDPGLDKPLVGSYGGLTFELPRSLLDSLKADFTNKPEP